MTIETAVGLISLLRTGTILNAFAVPFLLLAWLLLGGSGRNRRPGPKGVLISALVVDALLLVGAMLSDGWFEAAAGQAQESSTALLFGSPIAGLVAFGFLLARDLRFERSRRR